MSCIFQRQEDNQIILMCKGADSVITELLTDESREGKVFKDTQQTVDGFAKEGLRTLFLAERKLTQYEYDEW